ncbi:MAG: glycosyltransferase [Desulfobacterales bacterium]|nr:glycosyltransferase [Desulfobacterales bacterium]MBF0395575.1 glycosyltransferase [Desulfobacterales bacterium]
MEIGIVIIGINVEKYISDCIQSVKESNYPKELLKIVYVDGGSRDKSVDIAKSIEGVSVIELKEKHPTPGRGRNAGWKVLSAAYIQFLDGDTIIHPDWLKNAVNAFKIDIAAVCGKREERFPDKNIFHFITEVEWKYEIGYCRYFGGDVLIKRDVLEKTQGFDEYLIAGEDPELSYRIRGLGLKILRIDCKMTTHDINMSFFSQYLKRAYRSGYAYAEIGLKFLKTTEKLWLKELLRTSLKCLIPIFLIIFGFLNGFSFLGLILASIIVFKPFLKISEFKKKYDIKLEKAIFYSLHLSFVCFPQFVGILRYYAGLVMNNPLKNKGLNE